MNKKILKTVLAYPKLKERLKKHRGEKKRVPELVKEMYSNFSPTYVETTARLINATFKKLYDGYSFKVADGIDFVKLQKENNIILVPNHQSHADYIALTYMLWTEYKIPVHVAGGINLNIFPIGKWFRNSGCFFIRRTFANDITYKLTLEAYLYYLLRKGEIIEFFFEGGRSRTGKLLAPRFGLFQMLLESHSAIDEADKKPLLFVPVSIVHEVVPESRSHAKELKGGEKVKETSSGLLKMYKLFAIKMGSIHIKLGNPIRPAEDLSDIRSATRELAFDCYRAVGKQMMVSPTSIICTVLLDTSHPLSWEEIFYTSQMIIRYCKEFNVPLSEKLQEDSAVSTLRHALDILIDNKKVNIITRDKLKNRLFAIKNESRSELLYFKNTILHHFLVPFIINAGWVALFNGKITNVNEMNRFLINQRNQLKYEFYLPTTKELIELALKIVSSAVGAPIQKLDEVFNLKPSDIYKIAVKVGMFSQSFTHIIEGYYLAASTFKYIESEKFKRDEFYKTSREVFELEINHGRVIKRAESYSLPVLQNALQYFENQDYIERGEGGFKVNDYDKLQQLMDNFARYLAELSTFSLKVASFKVDHNVELNR